MIDFGVLTLLAALFCCSTAFAQVPSPFTSVSETSFAQLRRSDFEILPQPLATALKALANQSGLQLLYTPEIVAGIETTLVVGNYAPAQALSLLLQDTGLVAKFVSSDTLVIKLDEISDNNEATKADLAQQVVKTRPETEQGKILEEIIITAQKREQNLQDVGISVTVLQDKALKNLGLNSTLDVTAQAPGVQLNSFSPSFAIFNIRGVSQNNFSDNLEAPVATYADGAYIVSMNAVGARLFDTERVEVLRGPQGTLFGRNATGGLVHFISKRPTRAFNAYLETNWSENQNYSLEGALSGSLSESVLGRFSASAETADGYLKSQVPGVRDASGARGYAVRGQLEFDITANLQAWLKLHYETDDDVPDGAYVRSEATTDPVTGLGIITAAPSDKLAINSDYEGRLDRDNHSLTFNLDWELANGSRLIAISHYLDNDKYYTEDADASIAPDFVFTTLAEHRQWSEEVRWSGEINDSRWQLGVYYLDFLQLNRAFVKGAIANTVAGNPGQITSRAKLRASNWSVFGQYEHDISDQITAILGLRWSEDDKQFDYLAQRFELTGGAELQRIVYNPDTYADAKIDYGDTAARIELDWKPNQDTLWFASWSRGIKGGNWTMPSFISDVDPNNLRHDEETLQSYELGLKLIFWQGKARLNAAAFYYDYQDYQSFSVTDFNQNVVNRDARVKGGELELELLAMEGLDFSLGLSFLDTAVTDVPTAFPGVEVDAELPQAPALSINTMIGYHWPLLDGVLSAQLDMVYNSEQYLEVTNAPADLESDYFVGNFKLAYQTNSGAWRYALWVKNMTNTLYRIYNLDLGIAGYQESIYAPPRWFGMTASYHWQ